MKDNFIFVVHTDSIDLLKSKINTFMPDIKQILEYDINQSGIKNLLFDISSRPLVRTGRAFIINNLILNERKTNGNKDINLDKNPAGAIKYIYHILESEDINGFLINDVPKMDRKTYKGLGLDKIIAYSKRDRLMGLLDMDMSSVPADPDLEKFLDTHANKDTVLFVILPVNFFARAPESFMKKYPAINLIKEKKGFGNQPVDGSVKDHILEYAQKENIRIYDNAVSMLCEWTSNNIDAIKNELIKINALVPDDKWIDENTIRANMMRKSSIEWFWLINAIFNSDFMSAVNMIGEVYEGSLSVQDTEIDSFIFLLLPQMANYIHYALLANELRNTYALTDIINNGYQRFKSDTFNALVQKLKQDGLWTQQKTYNLLGLHPFRAYQFFTWASKYSENKLINIMLKIAQLDEKLKSSRMDPRNNLFVLISMIYF